MITFGDFGPARKEVVEATGVDNYNLRMSFAEGAVVTKGVLSEDGSQITSWGFSNSIETYKWLSQDEVDKIREDRDHVDTPR